MALLKRKQKQGEKPASKLPPAAAVSAAAHHQPAPDALRVLRHGHPSEKAHMLSAFNQYVFVVHDSANKRSVKTAVEQRYRVNVESVNIVREHGKTKRWRNVLGHRGGRKKAIVTVRAGQKIETT